MYTFIFFKNRLVANFTDVLGLLKVKCQLEWEEQIQTTFVIWGRVKESLDNHGQ